MFDVEEIAEFFSSKNFYPRSDERHVSISFKGLKFAIVPSDDDGVFTLQAFQPGAKEIQGFDKESTSFVPYRKKEVRCYTLDQLGKELGRFFKELDLVISENVTVDSLAMRVDSLVHVMNKMGYDAKVADGKDCANLIYFTFKGLQFHLYLDWTDYEFITLVLPVSDMPGATHEKNRVAAERLNRYKMLKNIRAVTRGERLYFVVEGFYATGLSFAQVLPRYLREFENAIRLYLKEIGFNFK